MAALLHVDEVDDDETAEIAQANLAGGFDGGLQVDGVDDVFLVAAAVAVGAGVDVDGDEGLGLVDDDFAAGGQGNLALAGLLDLTLDVEAFKDRNVVLVEGDLAAGTFGDLGNEILRVLVVFLVVDEDAVNLLGEEIADGALDEVRLLIEAGGGALKQGVRARALEEDSSRDLP